MITRSQYLEKALKKLPPDLPALAREIAQATQTPIEFAILAILAVLSAVYQSRATVKSPSGQISPLGLYVLIIGEASSGKTLVFRLLMKSLVKFNKQCKEEYDLAFAIYTAKMRVWKPKVEALERRLDVLKDKGLPTDEIEAKIAYLSSPSVKPTPPETKWLQGSDFSVPALVDYYRGTGKGAMIASEEASRFLKSPLFQKDDDFLNSLYSMEFPEKHRSRMNGDATDPLMTMLLLTQQTAFDKHIGKRLQDFVDSGCTNRLIVTNDDGFSSDGEIDITNTPLTDAFNDRIWNVLNQPIGERKLYELEGAAHPTFKTFRSVIHGDCKSGARLAGMKGAAKRRVELSVKVACILHCYYQTDGHISDALFKCAKDLMVHFMFEHQRIISSDDGLPRPMRLAKKLEVFIRERIEDGAVHYLNEPTQWNDLSHRSHIYGDDFKIAVDFLCSQGKLRVDRYRGQSGGLARYITLTRSHFDGSPTQSFLGCAWLNQEPDRSADIECAPFMGRNWELPDRY